MILESELIDASFVWSLRHPALPDLPAITALPSIAGLTAGPPHTVHGWRVLTHT